MKKKDLLSRLVTPTGTKGCASHVGAGCTFCPGCQTRDKRAPPFVPDWRYRLGNRDNSGFPTGTNQRFCSSGTRFHCLKENVETHVHPSLVGRLRMWWLDLDPSV